MPPKLAFLIYISIILWFFFRDQKLRPMTSVGLYVAFFWVVSVGMRPVSSWLSAGILIESPEDYLEGSPFDRAVYLTLIVLGFVVLIRRKVEWSRIFASNLWFFTFFLFWGVSIIWSDYPFVAFKRWIKDIGNVIMVLIILTEYDPGKAIKAIFIRYAYLAIPFSVLLIKYFPEKGRYYNQWSWEPMYCGITTNKNELGCVVLVCGLVLIWDLIERQNVDRSNTDRLDWWSHLGLLMMSFWLMKTAHCSTALVCLILGGCILFFFSRPLARGCIKYLGTFSIMFCAFIVLLYVVPEMAEGLLGIIGRDVTFTGRSEIWADLLRESVNPIVGTGYQSFWLGSGAEKLWAKYYFHPNQAHNGYLDTYLNGGLIGLFLLLGMIIAAGANLKKEILFGRGYGVVRLAFLTVAVFSNWTEAMFNRLGPLWIVMLLAALKDPRLPWPITGELFDADEENSFGVVPEPQQKVPCVAPTFCLESNVDRG